MPRSTITPLLALISAAPVSAAVEFHPAVHYPVGDKPEGGTLLDFNGDEHLDLVVSSDDPDKLEFFANQGDGTFVLVTTLLAERSSRPKGLACGDFDGDGDIDLVAAVYSSDEVQLILGDGAGGFTLGMKHDVGDQPSVIVAADFNVDGFLDAAVNNRQSDDVSVLLGNGDGSFEDAVHYPVGIETRCVAAGDITGDGRPDLAVSARDSHRVRVFESLDDGTFGVFRDLTMGNILEPQGVVLADFDSDGKLDVATATSGNELQEHVSIYLQDNFGNPWAGPINGATGGQSPTGIVAADFDGDGHIDAATANADSNNVSALRNGGIGIFFAPLVFTIGENPEAPILATGDLDGNGTPDLVTFNRDSDDVSILLNAAVFATLGDLDADGTVGFADLTALLLAWGPCVSFPALCPADLDDDWSVGFSDLTTLLLNWG